MIQKERISYLNHNSPRKHGEYVLYWMQASQRAEYNHALEFAIQQANGLRQPVIVYFGLTDAFPEANERHYRFMLDGLLETRDRLRDRGLGMIIERISPEKGAVKFAGQASVVVCDRGYLKIQKQWRRYVAEQIEAPLIQVESDVVVPVAAASSKEEYSAATLRRKLLPVLKRFLSPVPEETPRIDSSGLVSQSYDISDIPGTVANLNIDHTVRPVTGFHGGTKEGKARLAEFMGNKLDNYKDLRNDPNEDCLSNLSPYLHFGEISPVYLALQVSRRNDQNSEAFLEEMIVRRELSMNFVNYNPHYDSFDGLPDWAKRTLSEHRKDPRRYRYSREEFEQAQTHDACWNAAQKEMMITGKMHGYMRMYWGKKILEWTADPREAYTTVLYLNNKYELDGRDPNGYAGTAWCFGKHDRPWGRRPVFGNVRYMSADGLKRKFDVEKYNSDTLQRD